jgi:hypothetical protein
MDGDHRRLGGVLQRLFTERVETLNTAIGLIKRRRAWSAAAWVRLLVFGWIADPGRPFAALALLAGVSPQAFQQRLTDKAVALFEGLLKER